MLLSIVLFIVYVLFVLMMSTCTTLIFLDYSNYAKNNKEEYIQKLPTFIQRAFVKHKRLFDVIYQIARIIGVLACLSFIPMISLILWSFFSVDWTEFVR